MIVHFPDFDGDTAGIVEREIPDERIQKFLNWLLTANRYSFENNPEVTLDKVTRLRADLIAECRKAKAPEGKRPDGKPGFDITVEGLLALCDCTSVEELVEKVALAERVAETEPIGAEGA